MTRMTRINLFPIRVICAIRCLKFILYNLSVYLSKLSDLEVKLFLFTNHCLLFTDDCSLFTDNCLLMTE